MPVLSLSEDSLVWQKNSGTCIETLPSNIVLLNVLFNAVLISGREHVEGKQNPWKNSVFEGSVC